MKHYCVIILLMVVHLFGCTKVVKIDATTYLNHSVSYGGTHILIHAELREIFEHYEQLKEKDIEVTAPLSYFAERDSPSWFITLEKDGKSIRCYETEYRHFVPPNAIYLARWARNEGGEVTVRGKLKEWGIELDELRYKSLMVDTNDPPS